MHKFFVSKDNIKGDFASINGDDVKHIYKVLRLNVGDNIGINNCCGEEYLGEIISIDKSNVEVKLIKKLPINNESNLEIYLYQGFPNKPSKMDLIVQKSTEIGVRQIIPLITKRVVIKNESNNNKKINRWRKISLESCKQCKRSLIPEITMPIEFETLNSELEKMDLIIVPYEDQKDLGIKSVIKSLEGMKINKVGIVIGPEGGFEESEIEYLKDSGAYIVTLGPRILRTETAGLVTSSIIMYELGDLGGVYQ